MLHAIRSAVLAIVLVGTVAYGQIWTQDAAFHPALTNDTSALTSTGFVPTADGRVLMSGPFTHLKTGAVAARGLAILRSDGTQDSTFNAEVDTTESIITAVPLQDGRVLAERRNADGSLSLARFAADGHVDRTCTPIAAGYQFALQLQPDGRVLGWGYYITLNGTPRGHLVRFNADGTLDDAFNPIGLGFEFVSSVAAQSDGKIVASGVGGATGTRILIRLNADGTLDSTFAPQPRAVTLNQIVVQADGKVLAIGINSLERFNADGSPDTAFAPDVSHKYIKGVAARADGAVLVQVETNETGSDEIPTVLIISSDGKQVEDVRTVIGSNQAVQLACVMPDSSSWLIHGLPVRGYSPIQPTITPGAGVSLMTGTTASTTPTTTGPTGAASIMPPILPDVVPTRAVLSRLASDGVAVSNIDPGLLSRTDGYIGAMKIDAAGRVTIQGSFTAVDGIARAGLARFTAAGALDTAYAPSFGDAVLTRFLLLSPDGQVYGTTATLSSQATDGIYTTLEQQVHVRADGSIDVNFTPAVGYGLDVGWLTGSPDGRVLVSFFAPDNTQEANLRLGWLDASGALVSTLPTQFSGLSTMIAVGNGPIETVTTGGDSGSSASGTGVQPAPISGPYGNPFSFARVLADGKILLGGMFERVNGAPTPRLVRLNADGSVDTTYTPDRSGFINEPFASVDSKGRVLLSGQVLRNGTAINAVYRLLDDGSRDSAYYSVTDDLPSDTLLQLDNGLPDLNFPSRITKSDGTTVKIGSALMAANGVVWTMNPLARFTASDVATITVSPADRSVVSGHDTAFFVGLGTRDPATYQWSFNGAPLAGATLPYLPLNAVAATQAGHYSVRVTVDGQTLTSAAGTLTVMGGAVRLVNFSARADVTPDSTPIAGFVIADDGAKRDWLLRAMGPTLTHFGVTNTLIDPTLALFSDGSEIAHDAGSANTPEIWQMANRVGAFPVFVLFPSPIFENEESALIRTLSPGAYTASATSAGGNSGTVLLEVYDSIPGGASGSLRNVSLRTRTSPGAVATLGFVLVGNTPAKLLIRAVGPTLANFGVKDALPDPVVSVFSSAASTPVATNSGWADDGAVATASQDAGTFALPHGSRDAAMVLRLEPGAYTAQVTSAGGTSAEAMIEVYVMPQ